MYLHLADNPRVERDDGPPLPLPAADAALFAWLALEGPTPRRRLGSLLWPQSSEAQAATALRQRLFRLRKALGRELARGSPVLALAEGVRHDLADADGVLGALSLAEAPEFDAWLRRQRDERRTRRLQTLAAQAQALEDAGEVGAALAPAQALLALDALSESAHQRLMRLHYLGGDRAAALAAFGHCEAALRQELGVRPSAATLELKATIERAAAPAPRKTLPASVLRPPRMVGRERERQALRQAWDGAQVAAVIGEAGMGKSRLLAEVLGGLQAVARAAGRPGDAGVPFATLARLLRDVAERCPPVALDEATREALALMLPEMGRAGALPAPAQAPGLQRAVLVFLQAAPALQGLVVDDLHFADAASLEMLSSLAEPAGALRWAFAFRPAEAGSVLVDLQRTLAESARLVPVPVLPLDVAALAELVDGLALGIDGRAAAPALHQRTGGNPLFVLETLKQAWVEQSLPRLAEAPPRSASIERLIDQRIARLSPPALALARVAAVAGVDFDLDLAEQVLHTGAMHLADALGELESAQVLKGELFAHDLVYDGVLRSVPAAIARHTHARVAAWLARREGEPARIAQHFVEGGRPQEAVAWLARAATRSEQGLRLREAIAFLERKSQLEQAAGDAAAAFDSALQAARVSAGVDHELASGDERCARLDRLAATPQQAVAAQLWRAHLAELRDDPEGAEPALREALRRSLALADEVLTARCRLRLAAGLAIQDRLAEAAEHAEACREGLQRHGSDEERGELHGVLATIRDSDGRLEEAREHHAAAAACYESAGRLGKLADAHRDLASNYLFQGDSVHAREHLLLALRGYGQHDDHAAARGTALGPLGACNTTLGLFREALDCLAQARELMALHQPRALPFLAMYEASLWRQLGQWQRVHQALREVAAITQPPAAMQAGLLLQRHHQAKAAGHPDPTLLTQALAVAPGGAQTTLRMLIEVEHSLDLPPAEGLALLDEVAARAGRQGHGGVALTARTRAAEIAIGVDPALAQRHAQAVIAALPHHAYIGPYLVEPWLAAARAFAAAEDAGAARSALGHGRDWIAATVQRQLPPEFRASFVERNPANAALLSLAARHGLPAV